MKYEEYIIKKEYKLFNPSVIADAAFGHIAFTTCQPHSISDGLIIKSHSDDFTKIYYENMRTGDFCSLDASECSLNYKLLVYHMTPINKDKSHMYEYNEYISSQYVYEFSDDIKKGDYIRFKHNDDVFDAIVLCNKGEELYIAGNEEHESALRSMITCEFTTKYPYGLWILTPKIIHNDVEIIINPLHNDKTYKLDSHFEDILSFEQMLCKLYQGHSVRPITCPNYIYYIYDSVNKCVRNQNGDIINIWADDFNDCWVVYE
jgi:hypothetical protein